MKLKKLVSAGLVAIMATSLLAGCGGSKDSSETADGKKNLSIFIFANDHESTVYKSMIDQYKKDHADTIGNIDVQITTQDEYSKTLTGMMTAGDLPDIFYVGPESVEQFVENGYIEDLQPILDEKGISTDGMLAQEALDSYRYDGDKTGSGDLYDFQKMHLYLLMHTTKIYSMKQDWITRTRKIHTLMMNSLKSARNLQKIQTVMEKSTSGDADLQMHSCFSHSYGQTGQAI